MSDQIIGQVATLQHPTTNDPKAWKTYWEAQGWAWRTEPEIDADRQKYLAERRAIVPDIVQGIYPFRDVKLSRADIEWLLATHESGGIYGPVDWNDAKQRTRRGLDLRSVNLSGVDLSGLPLACMHGSLSAKERDATTKEQQNMAIVHLEGANLYKTHLEGAKLAKGHLEQADMSATYLEDARLYHAHLEGANLRFAYFDSSTNLDSVYLGDKKYGFASVVDVRWNDVNLAMVNWANIQVLGDEQKAHQLKTSDGKNSRSDYLRAYRRAVRANRQLATVLQSQGLNEEAARFAYRAQLCQRNVLRRQKKFGQYIFSGFLDLLAGYGYRPGRSVIWYLVTIIGFALAYFAIGHLPFFPDAFVFSLTSFHGRGFFPGLGNENSLHNPLVIMAAFEAVVGLLIEISFIATFTQRFFGR
jgi:uncharacterized protein YjbI with pentapeptide repeats